MSTGSLSRTGRNFTAVTLAELLSRTGCRFLSRLRNRFVCGLLGHAIDHMDPWNTRCFRCGRQWSYGDKVRDDLWFFLGLANLRHSTRFYRVWHWLKCPGCSERFGRHNPDNCFPF